MSRQMMTGADRPGALLASVLRSSTVRSGLPTEAASLPAPSDEPPAAVAIRELDEDDGCGAAGPPGAAAELPAGTQRKKLLRRLYHQARSRRTADGTSTKHRSRFIAGLKADYASANAPCELFLLAARRAIAGQSHIASAVRRQHSRTEQTPVPR